MRRTGSPAHEVGLSDHTGCKGDATFKSSAESARLTTTVAELGPGMPPKSKRFGRLEGESVCQARDGLDELLTSIQGGDAAENELVRGRQRRSLVFGAEVYEYELNWSVFPPWMSRELSSKAAA